MSFVGNYSHLDVKNYNKTKLNIMYSVMYSAYNMYDTIHDIYSAYNMRITNNINNMKWLKENKCPWDVSNITNMKYMMSGSKFDGDIGDWNTTNMTDVNNLVPSGIDKRIYNVSKFMMYCNVMRPHIDKNTYVASKHTMYDNNGIKTYIDKSVYEVLKFKLKQFVDTIMKNINAEPDHPQECIDYDSSEF